MWTLQICGERRAPSGSRMSCCAQLEEFKSVLLCCSERRAEQESETGDLPADPHPHRWSQALDNDWKKMRKDDLRVLRWFWHLTRMPFGRCLGEVLQACPNRKRPLGRSKISWRDYISQLGIASASPQKRRKKVGRRRSGCLLTLMSPQPRHGWMEPSLN